MQDGFWKHWQETSQRKLIPYVFKRMEETGHVDNFLKAAGQMDGQFRGEVYFDSDVYKLIEGAAYCLKLQPDQHLEEYINGVIGKICSAQQPDGYLHTYTILRRSQDRWKNPYLHELYCAGHLLEAGVAHYEATGKKTLLKVAVSLADNIDAAFGAGPGRLNLPPEHQEVELGLLRLYGATGDSRYLRLARFFLDQRGHCQGRKSYGAYAQDHLPILRQTEAVGHSVRAAYMYAAMADVVGYTGKRDYLVVLKRIFQDLVRGKMFISGGVGLLQRGNMYESFTEAYSLPNDKPDVDTCSVIGLVFWLHRMNLLEPDGRYGDIIERILYNRLLVGLSLDGTRFFYGCPLASRRPETFDRGPGAECDDKHCRPKWFRCICCPTNLPRLLATVGGYIYARNEHGLYISQYIASRAKIPIRDSPYEIGITTDYPWSGKIRIAVQPPEPMMLAIHLRIPGWAIGQEYPGGLYRATNTVEEVTLRINGRPVAMPKLHRGYARVHRRWEPGDIIELQLPMQIRRVKADPRVEAARNRVALMRGPILYCAEGVDHGGQVSHLVLPSDAKLNAEHRPHLLGGITILRGRVLARLGGPDGKSYVGPLDLKPVDFIAVPFYAWDNRSPGEMGVWIPERPELAEPTCEKELKL